MKPSAPTVKPNPPEFLEMLKWIALYVTEISSIESKRGYTIQLSAAHATKEETADLLITKNGKDAYDALRKAVNAGRKVFKVI